MTGRDTLERIDMGEANEDGNKTPLGLETMENYEEITPPNYVTQRNQKRGRDSPGTHFENFKEEMKQMMQDLLRTQQNELKAIILENKESNEKAIAILTGETAELKKKVEKLEIEKRQDKEYINLLEEKVEDLQRENRKNTIEIRNVPKVEKETRGDLVNMVMRLSNSIGHVVSPSDIADIYRVRAKQEGRQAGPIVVELTTSITKSDLLQKCKQHNVKNSSDKLCAKHLGHTKQENNPIYVTEQLTPKAARLHFLARDLAKSKDYLYCWTSFGRVYVRKNATSRVIQIKSEAQVQNLFLQT